MKKLIPLIAILLIGGLLLFISRQGPEKTYMEEAEPDMALEASTLFAEFAEDESAANEKYLNKTVLITGSIADVVSDRTGGMPLLKLDTGNSSGTVDCVFDEMTEHDRMEFHVGEVVTLKCVCMDFYRNVQLASCIMD